MSILGTKLFRNPWKNSLYGNETCFCDSGLKLKKCHGDEYFFTEKEMKNARILFEKWEESPRGIEFFREKRGKL